jgi:3-ketosteroid 9alpha-monooxygenase subunit B
MPEIKSTVQAIRHEAPLSVTIRMDLGGAPFTYRPGQYIEIDPHQFEDLTPEIRELEEKKGMPEMPRSFSLSSDALDPGFVEISVKQNPKDGPFHQLLAPFFVSKISPGRRIAFSGPNGKYCLPGTSPAGITGFLHLCAGSGVAPNRGMIQHALAVGWPQKHLLLLQNRTPEDVFFKAEWKDLETRHAGKFRIKHIHSVTAGEHLIPDIARRAMEGWIDGATSMAFVCGPNRPREVVAPDGTKSKEPGFCESWCGNPRRKIVGKLGELGFTPERILNEMW